MPVLTNKWCPGRRPAGVATLNACKQGALKALSLSRRYVSQLCCPAPESICANEALKKTPVCIYLQGDEMGPYFRQTSGPVRAAHRDCNGHESSRTPRY